MCVVDVGLRYLKNVSALYWWLFVRNRPNSALFGISCSSPTECWIFIPTGTIIIHIGRCITTARINSRILIWVVILNYNNISLPCIWVHLLSRWHEVHAAHSLFTDCIIDGEVVFPDFRGIVVLLPSYLLLGPRSDCVFLPCPSVAAVPVQGETAEQCPQREGDQGQHIGKLTSKFRSTNFR